DRDLLPHGRRPGVDIARSVVRDAACERADAGAGHAGGGVLGPYRRLCQRAHSRLVAAPERCAAAPWCPGATSNLATRLGPGGWPAAPASIGHLGLIAGQ